MPTAVQIVSKTKKKRDGTFVGKAADVMERYHRRRAEVLGDGEGGSTQDGASLLSENDLFLEVVGGRNKKGHVFGLGNMGEYFVKESQSTQSHVQLPATSQYAKKVDELEDAVKSRDLKLEEMNVAVRARDEKIEQMSIALQTLYERLGMTMPQVDVPSPMRTTENSVHNPDLDDDDGTADDGGNHPPATL